MRPFKRNPAAKHLGRVSKLLSQAAERSEHNQSAITNQAAFLARRCGLSTTRAALLAPIIFEEART